MRDDTHGTRSGSSRHTPTLTDRQSVSARPASTRPGWRPHLLQIVEGAGFRPEHMDDHVTGVDQHPVAMRHAFAPRVAHAGLGEFFQHVTRDRADMTAGPA